MKSALVIGGGMAGLVAARALAASGHVLPRVLESESMLGGKAASWRDDTGALVEAGLHVCFPHYRQLIALLEELGTSASVQWSAPVLTFLRPGGDVAQLKFPRLPPPMNGMLAIAGHRHLSAFDAMSSLLGAAEATLSTAAWRRRYEHISFAQWARRRGLSSTLVGSIFEPMIRGLTFLKGQDVSARAMLDYIHQVGSRTQGFRLGLFPAGCGASIIEPLAADIRRRAGEVRTGSPVAAIVMRDGRATGVTLADGTLLEADVVIAAVPAHALGALLPPSLRSQAPLRDAIRLRPVPVASVLAWFDRRLGGPPGLRLSPDCVFSAWVDRADFPDEADGARRSVLQFVIAPLEGEVAHDDGALVRQVLADLERLLPDARSARVERVVVTRTPQSVHAAEPGADALRPHSDVGVPGLLLAGDYVRTGLNPNLESATVSGLAAARLAIAEVA